MNTLNDAMFAKAVAHAAQMMENEPDEWNGANPQQVMFGGWNGEMMCPNNRAAFIQTYGVEQTFKITAAALKANEEKQNRKATSQYAQHLAAANDNAHADAFALNVGDFIICEDVGLKFDHENLHRHIRNFVHYAKEDEEDAKKPVSRDYKNVNERLVKIIRIEDHLEGFFDDTAHCLRNWKAQLQGEGMGYEGGSCTDDYDEDKSTAATQEERDEFYSTFYTLGVLVRDPSGRFVIIDPEGYEYPRYVLFRQDWRTMWAKDVAEAEREIAEAAENARKAEEARKEQERADYAALIKRFDYLPNKGRGLTTGKVAQNLRAALKHEFPGVKFSVRTERYSGGVNCNVTYNNGPSSDKVKKIVDLFKGAFGNDYGYFSYTFLTREIYAPLLQQIEEKVAELCTDTNGWSNDARRREVNDLIDRTDIPDGKALASVAWGDRPDFGHGLIATFAA